MASGQTVHYSLNQWQAGDQVLRAEFNQDNQKVDGALAGLAGQVSAKAEQSALEALRAETAAERLWVRLVDFTSAAADTAINLDLSQIQFLNFWEVRLLFYAPPCSTVRVLIHNDTQYHYRYHTPKLDTVGTCNSDSDTCLCTFPQQGAYPVAGRITTQIPIPGQCPTFWNNSFSLEGERYDRRYIRYTECTWETLGSLQFVCDQHIPAGARILMDGLRR